MSETVVVNGSGIHHEFKANGWEVDEDGRLDIKKKKKDGSFIVVATYNKESWDTVFDYEKEVKE